MRTLIVSAISGVLFFFFPLCGVHSSKIYIVPVVSTPEPGYVKNTIQFPESGQILDGDEMRGQIELLGFPLGVDTMQPRSKVIYNDPLGQSLHIFIDNEPYFSVNEALTDALQDFQDYFVQTVTFTASISSLSPGMHVLRALPVFSFNESLKGRTVLSTRIFYVREKKENFSFDPNKPFLTYNEPQGEYDYIPESPEPILLDFYLSNCKLSQDGFKLRISIDDEVIDTITSWQPYYIYGLKPGTHKIRTELLNPLNQAVQGSFNDVTRTIELVEHRQR